MRQILVHSLTLFLVIASVTRGQEDDDYEDNRSTHVPTITSTAIAVEATAGESVTFPCDVDSLGDFVLLWKRGGNRILFAGDLRIVRDDRIRTVGNSLRISPVQPGDSGEYTCQIASNPHRELPPKQLSHTLHVLDPSTISPGMRR